MHARMRSKVRATIWAPVRYRGYVGSLKKSVKPTSWNIDLSIFRKWNRKPQPPSMPLTQMRISRPMASLLRRAEAPKAALQIALAIIQNARLAFAIIYAIDYSDKSISLGLATHRQ
jgi:hypothetical protein